MEKLSLTGESGHSSLLSRQYVYYDNLKKYQPELYNQALGRMDKFTKGADPASIASTLNSFAISERDRELAALSHMFGYSIDKIPLEGNESYKQIIEAFNTVMNTKEILERNKNKMLFGMDKGLSTGIVADANFISGHFYKTISKALQENSPEMKSFFAASKNRIENGEDPITAYQIELKPIINNAIMDAAIATYEAAILPPSRKKGAEYDKYNTSKYTQEQKDFVNQLKILRNSGRPNFILDGFYENYHIEDLINNITKSITQTEKQTRYRNKRQASKAARDSLTSASKNFAINAQTGGKMQEWVNMAISQVAYEINKTENIKAIHTGNYGKNFKADSITFNISLPTEEVKRILQTHIETNNARDSDSSYRQNVLRMNELYDRIKHINKEGFIIFENDKTRTLGENFKRRGGFSAGEAIRLTDLDMILSQANMNSSSTFIGTIMQLAEGAIGSSNPEYEAAIKNNLARALAYFLFDDVKMLGKEYLSHGANAIHIFNLNGVFIPLSFFLSAAADAIANTKPSTIFKFNIDIAPILYPNGNPDGSEKWTMQDWNTQAEYTLNSTTIQLYFLKNFREIIREYLA